MDKDVAREFLTTPKGKNPSEIGEAVAVLYGEYHSYKKMALDLRLKVSDKFLSLRHRIFQLPNGIRWKVDNGQITLSKGYEISRLKNEEDQWLLAFAIVDAQLEQEVCTNVVNRVLEHNDSIRTALSAAAGVRCDSVDPLLLPLGFDIRFAISQQAWNQGKEWQDYCYDQIHQGIRVSLPECVSDLRQLLSKLENAMS